MANWKAGTSGDAAGASGCEYGVFLNFRGEDTRHGFTGFLYSSLVDAGVHTFMDEHKLPFSDVIRDRLEHAINNSKLYIPIFSRNYASSKWCLRELKLIMDNVSNSGDQKSIFPIFFLVEPDDVKLKTRPDGDAPYQAAFEDHKKKFPEEVEAWKTALGKVDDHKGWVVKKNTSQAEIVKSVVEKVLKKLETKHKLINEKIIGLDDPVESLKKLLDVNHSDVQLIGIYGMGGIGKTTAAKAVFNQLSSYFGKCCSFLEDVRENSLTKEGIVELQKKLLSDIIGFESLEQFKDIERGMERIGAILSTKKVLVVLDDVDSEERIKQLTGNPSLYSGSRIIITTRKIDVLQDKGFKGKILHYEMPKMDDGHALQLFCQHAFHQDFPLDDYRGLSSEIMSHMGGLPLAIKVVGSLLNGKGEAFWKEMLAKLKKEPEDEIQKKLRISYDDLDKYQKQIFLDIACFFFNEKKTNAIYMWESCSFYPERGIDALISRCLIKILDNDKFWMHDQLIHLGRQIVREESPYDLEKQSRLWIVEEALQIIKTEKRKDMVQMLSIMIPEITSQDFERFPSLRFLELWNGTYTGDFERCHSNLRWFFWCYSHFDKDFRADNLYMDRLVICKLYAVNFKDDSKAWDLIKKARALKVLSFNLCSGITTIPDISNCLSLERLTLECCFNLKRIESFIGNLQSLIELKIERCENLTNLPKEIGALVKLKYFSLSECSRLRELPSSIWTLTSLMELDLSGTSRRELPFKLSVDWENHDQQLRSGISTPINLEVLDLSRNKEMKGEISVEIGKLSSLRSLNLEGTSISSLPTAINVLHHLQKLILRDCHEIQELPKLPTSLAYLYLESNSLLSIPSLLNLTNLVGLLLSNRRFKVNGCNLWGIGRSIKLKKLELNLLDVVAPPELASLSHLEELVLSHLDLESLVQLPSSSWRLRNLLTLEIYWCEVEDFPLDGFPQLEAFKLENCPKLQRLSIPSKLGKLRQMDVFRCKELVEIKVVGLLKSFKCLHIQTCDSLKTISGLSYSRNLKEMTIRTCGVLTDVEGLDELDSLESLEVWECSSLRRRIDASCTNLPDDCRVAVNACGNPFMETYGVKTLKHYKENIIFHTSKEVELVTSEVELPFVIDFILEIKQLHDVSSETLRRQIYVTLDTVTYEGLIAEVKSFGFLFKRMWYRVPDEDRELLIEIKSDEQVQGMMQLASKRGSICLIVEGGVENSLEGAMIEHFLVFFFCVACFLFLWHLRRKSDFPRKMAQLAGMRGFSLCEDFVVIFVLHLFLFFGFK